VLGRCDGLRRVAVDRGARMALGAAIGLAAAFATSLAAPMAWFVWAPLVLGVPHVLADVRYLILAPYRPVALRRRDGVLAVGLVGTAAVAAPALGAAVVVGAVALAPGRATRRRAAVLAAGLALACAAWAAPVVTSYAIMHAHNVVALAVLGAIAGRVGWGVGAGALALVGLVWTGALDAAMPSRALDGVARYVLPDVALAAWSTAACARVAVTFVFLQGVHYAVWLRLIPAALRAHGGLRGFGASVRALERDCTAPIAAAVAVVALALPALALVGASDAATLRELYVRLAGGHAYLELAVLARWLAASR
jgi:hypothetical protein